MLKRLRMDVETEIDVKKQKTGDDTVEQKVGEVDGIKDDSMTDDMTTETTTFEEDDDLETDGVNILDTSKRSQISQSFANLEEKNRPKLEAGFGFKLDTMQARTNASKQSKAQKLQRVRKAPDVIVVREEVKDTASKSREMVDVTYKHSVEHVSKGASSKTDATLHLPETKAAGPRVDNNLNEPETPETDVIHAGQRQQWTLPSPPNQVPISYADISPRKPPTEKKTKFCGIQFDKQKPDQQTNILIPHENADKPEGDDFGASLSTYTEHETYRKTYHRHFLVKVQPDEPASEMKIHNKDELVLLNDVFVPVLDHTEVLNLFHQVKVDGKTRTLLVVRRKLTKEKWEWIETSAVLSGQKQTDHPAVTKVIYKKIDGEETVYRPLSMHRYKIPENQMCIDIRDGKVQLNVLNRGSNKSTIIWKHAKFWQSDSEGHIDFASTLCDFTKKWFIAIDQHVDQIVVARDPVWFKMIKVGSKIRFQYQKLYLGYDLESNKLEAQVTDCLFEELPVSSADTVDTGAASRIRQVADETKTNSEIQSQRPPLHINVAMQENGINPVTSNDAPLSADSGTSGFEYGRSSSSGTNNVKRMSSHSSETSGYMSSTPDPVENTPPIEPRANFPTEGFLWRPNWAPLDATPTTPMQKLDLSGSEVD